METLPSHESPPPAHHPKTARLIGSEGGNFTGGLEFGLPLRISLDFNKFVYREATDGDEHAQGHAFSNIVRDNLRSMEREVRCAYRIIVLVEFFGHGSWPGKGSLKIHLVHIGRHVIPLVQAPAGTGPVDAAMELPVR